MLEVGVPQLFPSTCWNSATAIPYIFANCGTVTPYRTQTLIRRISEAEIGRVSSVCALLSCTLLAAGEMGEMLKMRGV